MKTKEEILKMSKEELSDYKWNDDLNISEEKDKNSNCSYCSNCSNCSNCFDCSYCSNCSNCSNCSYCFNCFKLANGLYCRNLKLKEKDYDKYWICNVEVTKEEFEAKKKELGIK